MNVRGTASDALLIRYLDGEAAAEEVARVEGAGPGSPTSARLWELREATERLSRAAAEVDVPPLPPLRLPQRRRWEAKAAGVALLLAAGAAVAMPPTRGVIVRRLRDAGAWISSRTEEAPVRIDTGGSVTVGVMPQRGTFLVEVESEQAAGSLVIHVRDGSTVRARSAGAELLVLPGGLRIRNRPEDTGDVTLEVPRSLERVRVLVAGEEHLVEVGSAPSVTIPLSDSGR